MRQPLAGKPLSCAAFLPYPDQILDCAWQDFDDCLCVPRQLSELLNQPLEDFIEYFNQFYDSESWQSEGVSASDLKQWCVQHGYGFYCAMGYRLLESVEPRGKN